jgi:hypothetical protein
MTSHEMRNPLSAILHYAKEIINTLRWCGANVVIGTGYSRHSSVTKVRNSPPDAETDSGFPNQLKKQLMRLGRLSTVRHIKSVLSTIF